MFWLCRDWKRAAAPIAPLRLDESTGRCDPTHLTYYRHDINIEMCLECGASLESSNKQLFFIAPPPERNKLEERRSVPMLSLLNREEGQGLVEYGLIIFLVAIVIIAILVLLGPQIGSIFSQVTGSI